MTQCVNENKNKNKLFPRLFFFRSDRDSNPHIRRRRKEEEKKRRRRNKEANANASECSYGPPGVESRAGETDCDYYDGAVTLASIDSVLSWAVAEGEAFAEKPLLMLELVRCRCTNIDPRESS